LIQGDVSPGKIGTAQRWLAAVYLGLISSTFSTVVSQLSAARIGRDATVDWMSVAAIPARDWTLTADPSIAAVAVGIAFHFILVPLFPFWRPIFTLQQPYWIGFLVHLSSASMYPLFAWLRRSVSERKA